MEIKTIFSDLPTIETERLILRKISMDDLEDIFYYGSNDNVTKYVTWDTHKTVEDTSFFIDYALNQYENKNVAPWGIVYKESGKLIGTIDFVWWQPAQKTAEIGYVLSEDYWGKGITTEAANELIRFGFHRMGLIRLQARCLVGNVGSERVMEKTGMSFEGIIRKGIFIKGAHQDLKLYSILKDEYFSE